MVSGVPQRRNLVRSPAGPLSSALAMGSSSIQSPTLRVLSGPGRARASFSHTLINAVVTSTRFTAALGRMMCSGLSFGTVSLTRQ